MPGPLKRFEDLVATFGAGYTPSKGAVQHIYIGVSYRRTSTEGVLAPDPRGLHGFQDTGDC